MLLRQLSGRPHNVRADDPVPSAKIALAAALAGKLSEQKGEAP
jgi:hypothetical protein